MNIIEVKNLTKTYKTRGHETQALRGISFDVKKGEIFGLLGVNGAGKSTTLNILVGLLTPTAGSIQIFEKNFSQHESDIKASMNIGTAYADLASNLTVYRNLKIYGLMYNVANREKKITGLLETFGIAHLANKWFTDLSAGEKTRVNLCKSLINDPELLLLDEPTASLDPSIASHVRRSILNLQKKRKMTVVFTSHNMPEVEEMCDRVALLHKGQIYMIDSPKSLITAHKAPDLEQVFIRLAKGEFEE